MIISPDRILAVLAAVTIVLIARPLGGNAPDPREVIAYDCRLFYGEAGLQAESECQSRLLIGHGLTAYSR